MNQSNTKVNKSETTAERLKAWRARRNFTQAQAAKVLGVGRTYYSQLENGRVSEGLALEKFKILEAEPVHSVNSRDVHLGIETVPLRRIPLLSWAQAGDAVEYDELPASWQKTVPTDLGDPKAFAVTIAGDSMEDRYEDGDIAILNPSAPFKQNGLVVAVLDDPSISGTVFKLCSRDGKSYHFSSLNPAYKAFEVDAEHVKRLYRVHSVMKIIK